MGGVQDQEETKALPRRLLIEQPHAEHPGSDAHGGIAHENDKSRAGDVAAVPAYLPDRRDRGEEHRDRYCRGERSCMSFGANRALLLAEAIAVARLAMLRSPILLARLHRVPRHALRPGSLRISELLDGFGWGNNSGWRRTEDPLSMSSATSS